MTHTPLRRGLLGLALVVTIGFLALHGPAPGARAGAPEPFEDQTANKTAAPMPKNVQVLKDLPPAQLLSLMNLMSASLGFTCVNCHVKTGDQWAYDRDDKKNKQTARKMIQMTLEINKAHFNGKPEVTCYACHQGQGHPPVVPPVPQVGAAGVASKPATKPVSPPQVLAKYVEAVGGKEAVEKLKTRALKGSHVTLDGARLPLEVWFAAPANVLVTLTTPKQGLLYQGLHGSTGWIKGDRESRAMDSVELARIKSLASNLEALQLKEPYPRMGFGGTEKIGDREAWVLQTTLPDKRRVRLYFDTQTGLLLRRVALTDTILGPDPEQTDYDDYRVVDGVKVPFTIRASYLAPAFSGTLQFTEVKHNMPIADSQFNPPGAKP